jgi:peptidoglycan-associated lipoprotein
MRSKSGQDGVQRRYFLGLSALAALSILAACGSGGGSDSVTTGTGQDRGTSSTNVDQTNLNEALQRELQAQGVTDRVLFATDSSELDTEARRVAERWATILRGGRFAAMRATIEGHADERGTREYNLGLGDRRAAAIRSYLVSLGVGGDRLTVVSYGKEKPAVVGGTEQAWSQNRRGVLVPAY